VSPSRILRTSWTFKSVASTCSATPAWPIAIPEPQETIKYFLQLFRVDRFQWRFGAAPRLYRRQFAASRK
jgi:hypothetical protein